MAVLLEAQAVNVVYEPSRGQRIWSVRLNGENAGKPVGYFTQQYGRIRNVSLAPNGDLWALSNNENPDFALILSLPG